VKLPHFLPGLGTLYVNPSTLPEGPFLAYDHAGKLVSTIYMILLKDLDPRKGFTDLAAPGGKVDHVPAAMRKSGPITTPVSLTSRNGESASLAEDGVSLASLRISGAAGSASAGGKRASGKGR
jgi:hypothetical protein